MRSISTAVSILTLLSVFLAACGPVTPVSTVTLAPSSTLLPTATNSPKPSATATESQYEEFFSRPTFSPHMIETPTAIAPPAFQTSAMKLRTLSDEQLLDIAYRMNEYSYQNYPPLYDWWIQQQFISSQEPVALLIQEYLYRFPDGDEADRLRWQLAFINSIMYEGLQGNPYGDEWILAQLEESLNRGDTAPEKLEKILEQHWFDVAIVKTVPGLFGQGTMGWVYQVVPQIWVEDNLAGDHSVFAGSMFFAVREFQKGAFEIYLLDSAWNLSFGESNLFDISDHNQNGNPEVTLYIGAHSGTMCSGQWQIYEWKTDAFIELHNPNFSLNECSESFEYAARDGFPAVILTRTFAFRKELYLWNGNEYEFSSYVDATPLESWRHMVLSPSHSYEEEAKRLEQILATSEPLKLGSGYSDFLRFRLGVAHAFLSQSEAAVQVLEDLVSSPSDTTGKIFPELAEVFLKYYSENTGLYSACQQANQAYDELSLSYADDYAGLLNAMGFTEEGSEYLFSMHLCDEQDAFLFIVRSIPASVTDIETRMREGGVPVTRVVDVKSMIAAPNRLQLVVFDESHFFLVYPDGSHYDTKEMDGGYIGDSITDRSPIEVILDRWAISPDPIMTIYSGNDFILLRLNEQFESNMLIAEFAVADYRISNQQSIPQIQLSYHEPGPTASYPDRPLSVYRWDMAQKAFKNDGLEYQLFVQHDPVQAVEIATQTLQLLDAWTEIDEASSWRLPYIYYLCGLSYELSGDEEKASQLYWELWSRYPESHYAMIARDKLETVAP